MNSGCQGQQIGLGSKQEWKCCQQNINGEKRCRVKLRTCGVTFYEMYNMRQECGGEVLVKVSRLKLSSTNALSRYTFQLSKRWSINKDHTRHFLFRSPTVRQSVTWTKLVRLWGWELASYRQKAVRLMGEIQIRISRLPNSLFSHLSLFLLFLVNRTKLQLQKRSCWCLHSNMPLFILKHTTIR